MKQPKDSEVASGVVYHFDLNGPYSRNAWGLYEARTIGTVKVGEFVVAEMVGPGTSRDEKKAHAIARVMARMNTMTTAEIEALLGR